MKPLRTIGLMGILVGSAVASLSAAVVFNPCDSMTGFSVAPSFNPPDYGVQADGGLEGSSPLTVDNGIFFTPRADNDHALSWNISAVVTPADTLTVDVRNVLILGAATLSVNVYYDGLAKPYVGLKDFKLDDDLFHSIKVTMPGGGTHRINRIEFVVAENTKVVLIDNLTLTVVPQ